MGNGAVAVWLVFGAFRLAWGGVSGGRSVSFGGRGESIKNCRKGGVIENVVEWLFQLIGIAGIDRSPPGPPAV